MESQWQEIADLPNSLSEAVSVGDINTKFKSPWFKKTTHPDAMAKPKEVEQPSPTLGDIQVPSRNVQVPGDVQVP